MKSPFKLQWTNKYLDVKFKDNSTLSYQSWMSDKKLEFYLETDWRYWSRARTWEHTFFYPVMSWNDVEECDDPNAIWSVVEAYDVIVAPTDFSRLEVALIGDLCWASGLSVSIVMGVMKHLVIQELASLYPDMLNEDAYIRIHDYREKENQNERTEEGC